MARIFAYCRVSTGSQTTENQVFAIKAAGFDIDAARIVTETVSGSLPACERKAFSILINHKLEAGDVLIVTKLDRLGRNAMDVRTTVETLEAKGSRFTVLPSAAQTSPVQPAK